jgi:hypothetical protein
VPRQLDRRCQSPAVVPAATSSLPALGCGRGVGVHIRRIACARCGSVGNEGHKNQLGSRGAFRMMRSIPFSCPTCWSMRTRTRVVAGAPRGDEAVTADSRHERGRPRFPSLRLAPTGLKTPRHLVDFTWVGVSPLLAGAGFAAEKVATTAAGVRGVAPFSRTCREHHSMYTDHRHSVGPVRTGQAMLRAGLERAPCTLERPAGEEILAVARA